MLRRALASVVAFVLLACSGEAVRYRSGVLATPISIPADPRNRRITAVEIAVDDLGSDETAGSIVLDDRPWDVDAFGDAAARAPAPAPTPVVLRRIADPDGAGKGRRLFLLEFPNGELERRIYFSWAPASAWDSYVLVRREEGTPPLPILVDPLREQDPLRSMVSYAHVLPMLREAEIPSDDDAPLGERIWLSSFPFTFGDEPEIPEPYFQWMRSLSLIQIQIDASGESASFSHYFERLSFTPFGERAMYGLSEGEPRTVRLVPQPADPTQAKGRRRLEIVLLPSEAAAAGPHRYFLVLAPTLAGAHRLIVEREGQVRHVLPLFDAPWRDTRMRLADLAPGAARERRALLDISRLAAPDWNFHVRGGHVRSLELHGAGCRGDAVSRVADLVGLERLELQLCPAEIPPETLAGLGALAKLKTLAFMGSPLSDAGLAALAQHATPSELNVHQKWQDAPPPGPALTDRGLLALADMASLRKLSLARDGIGRPALEILPRLEQLSSLFLDSADLTRADALRLTRELPRADVHVRLPEGYVETHAGELSVLDVLDSAQLDELVGFAPLKTLHLTPGSSVTAGDLKRLARFPDLRTLDVTLERTPVSDELDAIASLSQLRTLTLNGPVTDADVGRLGSMKDLAFLYLHETQVSEAGAAELRTRLPSCLVNR